MCFPNVWRNCCEFQHCGICGQVNEMWELNKPAAPQTVLLLGLFFTAWAAFVLRIWIRTQFTDPCFLCYVCSLVDVGAGLWRHKAMSDAAAERAQLMQGLIDKKDRLVAACSENWEAWVSAKPWKHGSGLRCLIVWVFTLEIFYWYTYIYVLYLLLTTAYTFTIIITD